MIVQIFLAAPVQICVDARNRVGLVFGIGKRQEDNTNRDMQNCHSRTVVCWTNNPPAGTSLPLYL